VASEPLGRRVFLARAAGLVLTLGAAPVGWARLGRRPRGRETRAGSPYDAGLWLAGDHHIHTRYSSDGRYEIAEQVAGAARSGLDFCVITDHGGPLHDKVLLQRAYPELIAARRAHPEMLVFQGLEWNIPDAEHGSVIVPPGESEAEVVAEFEARFDAHRPRPRPLGEEDAVAGVRFLQAQQHKPLFFANHPARRGLDSPHELRAWADAGPDVTRGFEGAPGHPAATLIGDLRGHYSVPAHPPGSFPGYPPESYRTFGGYDAYVAQVGGLWDSLLAEGRPFYITANSDSHRWHGDFIEVDRSRFRTEGFVTPTGRTLLPGKRQDSDYPPGTYCQTRVFAARRDPHAVLAGMRQGNMYTVLGGLIDGLMLWLHDGEQAAPMGGTLLVRRGAAIELVLEVRPASRRNLGGVLPTLEHIDLIVGDITGPAADRDTLRCPSARTLVRWPAREGTRRGDVLTFRYRFPPPRRDFFVRVRGTNTDVTAPVMDPPGIDPWGDLWFYSNPIFVRVPP
jgi:hypothetical protein